MIPPVLSAVLPPGTGDGVPGKVVSNASGNPGVATVNNRTTKQPGNNYGGDKPNGHVWSPGVMNPPHTAWRGGADFANDKLLTSDRHILVKRGNPRVGVQESVTGDPPNPDAPQFGPPQPAFGAVNRSFSYQQGTDNTLNQDDFTRAYSRVPNEPSSTPQWGLQKFPSRANDQQYAGEQGTGWSPIYGGVPGLYQPYGSYSGYTANAVKGIQSPAEQGTAGDGPRKVFSGPPHGLHSNTYPSMTNTIKRSTVVPQQHSPRVDRPDNSKIAGQDYSQTVQPQGQATMVTAATQRYQGRSRFAGG
ncbi:MAG TPA: hypothetical protein VN861_14615 [Candidatus Acidoferrales bacterium]|nr:hypothetical protein [Candidatus Acidoferrales bacterium]